MRRVISLFIVVSISLFSGCYALNHGYSWEYRRLSLQKAVVFISVERRFNRYHYRCYTLPSYMECTFDEFDTIRYYAGDTIKIDRYLANKLGINYYALCK